jgi:GNAT superfamily N-acetyltransferase
MPLPELHLEIRPPWPPEAPIFGRLLPGAAPGADRLVAASRHSQEILAAAAWTYLDDRSSGLRVEVRPAFRRQGLGRALGAAAIAACRYRGCLSLDANLARADHSAAPGFLQSMGFHLESSLTSVAVDVESQRMALHAAFTGFVLPAAHALLDCQAAGLAPLCRLWYSPDRPAGALAFLANAHNQAARALYQGPNPRAFVFYGRHPETLTIDLWAADPAFRGTRANLALMASLVLPALTDGTRELHFSWIDGARHTPGLAARFAARTIAIHDRYLLPLLT